MISLFAIYSNNNFKKRKREKKGKKISKREKGEGGVKKKLK